jgi:hypothetical protein
MIPPMALSPGGGRSPSASPPPAPPQVGEPRRSQSGRKPLWPRSASVSVVRLGVLIGGLVIIVDLLAQLLIERGASADDLALIQWADEIANYILFSLLGILVVRDTGLMYAGVVAGALGSLLDAIVVAAATVMAPQVTPMAVVEEGFIDNLAIGTVFAGLSGVVYALVQRWSGSRRAK